jgi:hypothetical protein
MYLASEVVAFKEAWDALDADGSGFVDADEILNNTGGGGGGGEEEGGAASAASAGVNAMSPSDLRMAKSIFASADTDMSGELSMMELLCVQFPLASLRQKEAMIKFLAWREACARARAHVAVERRDRLEDALVAAADSARYRLELEGGDAAVAAAEAEAAAAAAAAESTRRTEGSQEGEGSGQQQQGLGRLSSTAQQIYELLKASQGRRRRAVATLRTAGVRK